MNQREFNQEVGRRIRERRVRAGLTQEDLGDAVDLARTSVTNFENGNQAVTLWLAYRLSMALDCEADDLIPSSTDELDMGMPADMTPKTAALLRRLSVASQ
jgi:DNA-binding XRE family transcriptional regulator